MLRHTVIDALRKGMWELYARVIKGEHAVERLQHVQQVRSNAKYNKDNPVDDPPSLREVKDQHASTGLCVC